MKETSYPFASGCGPPRGICSAIAAARRGADAASTPTTPATSTLYISSHIPLNLIIFVSFGDPGSTPATSTVNIPFPWQHHPWMDSSENRRLFSLSLDGRPRRFRPQFYMRRRQNRTEIGPAPDSFLNYLLTNKNITGSPFYLLLILPLGSGVNNEGVAGNFDLDSVLNYIYINLYEYLKSKGILITLSCSVSE
jgi:hypothetical protein